MSCEPGRKVAYSPDLRNRMIWQRIAMELPFRTIAQNLSVSVGTVHNVFKLFEQTGSVDPSKPDRANTRVLSQYDELLVIGLLLENPSLYLGEICREVEHITGICVTPSTICRIIHRHGFTRKKIQQVALQRSSEHRGDFMAEMQFFTVDQLVWLDETGCDKRDHIRKMGYAMKGDRPVYHRILHRGQRISAIAAMCSDGVIALELEGGTYNGDKFVEFITGTLIPEMFQFEGSNPRSVLVMDNCAIHHVSSALKVLSDAGILAIFLPPYSPDLNPAEELFSFVKYYLKEHDDVLQAVSDPKPVIRAAFNSVTSQDCLGWIHHSGYY